MSGLRVSEKRECEAAWIGRRAIYYHVIVIWLDRWVVIKVVTNK